MSEGGVDRMREAAIALRDALDDEHRAGLTLSFDDEQERRNWAYWPAPRQGVPFSDMTPDQQQLAYGVVAAVLSVPAYAKVTTIIGLEEVLRELELGGRGRRRPDGLPRDPSKYYTTLFGNPGGPPGDPWGWRFEGHHVSLHVTVAGEEVAGTPAFLGANPAEVRHGDRIVLRPLAEEEDTARALLASLPEQQRRRALIDDQAPDDILTMNSPRVEVELEGGVPVADLSATAADIADELLGLHTDRLTLPVPADTAGVHFAWAGSSDRGERHYYRLAGPRFLVEYDNTQNDANHCHSVWRDPQDDFGDDVLRRHIAEHHAT